MKQSPFLLQLVIPFAKTGYNPDDLSGQIVIHTYKTGVPKENHCSQVIKTVIVLITSITVTTQQSMKLIGYVIVLESHLSCFPPNTAQNRQEAMYIGGKQNWRERTYIWRKRDFSKC